MYPGSIYSITSGFVDYSAKVCNLRKKEGFEGESEINNPRSTLFIILMLLLVCIMIILVFCLVVVPWKATNKLHNGSFIRKFFIIFGFIFLPFINLVFLANDANKLVSRY